MKNKRKKKLTLLVPDKIHEEVKILAARRRTTMSALGTKALAEHLKRDCRCSEALEGVAASA